MKFDLIVADCPWVCSDKLRMSATKRGADDNYPTLTIEELIKLPVKDIANPEGSLLGLWVLNSMLTEGLSVMKAWGFEQKQLFVWAKSVKKPFKKSKKEPNLNNMLGIGMGRMFRAASEVCLIGINTTAIYKKLKNKGQRSVALDYNEGHSKKPETLQDRLELMFPHAVAEGKAIELFARREREGWVCLGNEVGDKKDIRDSLQELIDQ